MGKALLFATFSMDTAQEVQNPRISLKEIAKPLSGYAFKSKKYSINGKYVVVKIGNVKPFHFDFSRDFTKTIEVDDAILSRYLLTRGDCLISVSNYCETTSIDLEQYFWSLIYDSPIEDMRKELKDNTKELKSIGKSIDIMAKAQQEEREQNHA